MCCDAVTRCVLSCSVTSSEKVDKAQRYADFTLLSIPYPGRGSFQGLVKGQASQDWGSLRPSSGPGHLGAQMPRSSRTGSAVTQHRAVQLLVLGSHLRVGRCPCVCVCRGAFPWERPRNGVLAQVLPTALLSELLHLATSPASGFLRYHWKLVRLSSGSCCVDWVRSGLSACSVQLMCCFGVK